MSKASKRKKRERNLEKLATAKMLCALKGEQQTLVRCVISVDVHESQISQLETVQSAVRRLARCIPGAKVNVDVVPLRSWTQSP